MQCHPRGRATGEATVSKVGGVRDATFWKNSLGHGGSQTSMTGPPPTVGKAPCSGRASRAGLQFSGHIQQQVHDRGNQADDDASPKPQSRNRPRCKALDHLSNEPEEQGH